MQNENNITLYSISQAARMMTIGRSTLKSLIDQGAIGVIQLGKRKKISHSEIIRFQKERTIKITKVNDIQQKPKLYTVIGNNKVNCKSLLDNIIKREIK